MKRLEALIRQQPELMPEVFILRMLLRITSNPKWTTPVFEDSDVRGFFLMMVGEDLVAQGFMSQAQIDEMPAGRWHSYELSRQNLDALVAASQSMTRELANNAFLAGIRSPIESNIGRFCQLFGFNDNDQALLTLLLTLQYSEVLDSAAKKIHFYNFEHLCRFLAGLLDMDPGSVLESLGNQSRLRQAGVIVMREGYSSRFEQLCDIRPIDALCKVLSKEAFDESTLLRTLVNPMPTASLVLEDYAHVKDQIDDLMMLLNDPSANHSILVYGPPGAGKTQLALLLARQKNLKAFEVPSVEENNKPIHPGARINTFNVAQNLLAIRNHSALLVFDEVEDVFRGRVGDEEFCSKAWFNHLLDTIRVPTIWLSNHSNIDPAFLRRFSYVMELNHPDRKTKQTLIRKYHPGVKLRKAFLDELSGYQSVSIASIRQACSHAERSGLTGPAAERFLARSVAGKFAAEGGRPLRFKSLQPRAKRNSGADHYPFDPRYINANEDIKVIERGLQRTGEGRLILFGPPGTGKTAFVHYLAGRLQKKLLHKDAARLVDCFVGMTERLIHQAFKEASRKGAMLFIDEADSFLSERTAHQHSWQTSQVNQLLQEMERFRGILIMSTNLMQTLDTAALRRFDYKVAFSYLTLQQRLDFFAEWLSRHGDSRDFDQETFRWRLQKLDRIVPGHFQLLTRQAAISGIRFSADVLYEKLAFEMALAERKISRPIGFTV